MFQASCRNQLFWIVNIIICSVLLILINQSSPLLVTVEAGQTTMTVASSSRVEEIKLVAIKGPDSGRFGARMSARIEGLIGKDVDDFLKSGVLDQLLFHNISVLFRAGAEREGPRIVTGVYPDVFYSGCVVVIETSGRMPAN